ncbi:MAG: type II/IV secretion system protein [Phycisphaerae bacterium]|nr:type II/IV secretion system protein [Phycisphaerae bacterium]
MRSVFLDRVPEAFARRHLVLGRMGADGVERLAFASSSGGAAVHNAAAHTGLEPEALASDPETLAREIDAAYAPRAGGAGSVGPEDQGEPGKPEGDVEATLAGALRAGESELLATDGKGAVSRLVDAIVFDAIGRRASDVHIHPVADRTLVRYRLDGVLTTVRELPVRLAAPMISRVKVLASMDVAERRTPQDGRATVTIGRSAGVPGRSVDLRVSSIPTSYGERLVLRLLDTERDRSLTTFEAVGMPPEVLGPFRERCGRASGMVLVTGPTGSGKTTTLYAALRWIAGRRDAVGLNVLTIEDPVEYDLSALGERPGGGPLPISQTQVDPRKGLTFASGLRHMLRQDPDVIMVGEIRDQDTARIALQASLTGHLVLSTLHTSDSVGAVTRLCDLGAERFLIASCLSAVLAQRLVRRLHAPCGGRGCDGCLSTGYRGRTGLFELLCVDAGVRALISGGSSEAEIRAAGAASGLRTLAEHGRVLVDAGWTTANEIARVCDGADS